jgi:DNA polymerase type B, organellar and viral
MLENSIKYLMREKYNKHKVYLHNFSYFDSIFMINTFSNLSDKINPLMRDNRIIDFKFYYGNNNIYYINFRDSLLLLPEALSKLAKSFNIENKGIFPFKFLDNKYNKKKKLI